jgi:hypothetical protein
MILTKELQKTLSKYFEYFDTEELREVPMRWVSGEIPEHTDFAEKYRTEFETSVVIYLNDVPSSRFNIDGKSYAIEKNTAFIFPQDTKHSVSVATVSVAVNEKIMDFFLNKKTGFPRLIIGPMNEIAKSIGIPPGYFFFDNILDANSFTNILSSQIYSQPILSPIESGLTVPTGYTFNGWLLAPNSYPSDQSFSNGFPNNQLYLSGQTYYDSSYTIFSYALYPSYTIPAANPYIVYGGGNSSGNFWYGNSTGFPGFLYKKNVGVGTRRSTKLGAGGNNIAPKAYLYNKYKPGINGIGASSISNRRAKNRLASICPPESSCGKFQTFLGRYPTYSYNSNGYFPYPPLPIPIPSIQPISILFDGTQNYLSYPGIILGSNAFTIQCWFKINTTSLKQSILGSLQDSFSGMSISIYNANYIIIDRGFFYSSFFEVPELQINTWYYLVYVRNDFNANLYLNGIQNLSGIQSDFYDYSISSLIGCMCSTSSSIPINFFNGYLNNLCISSEALFDLIDTTIPIPTAPFTANSNTMLLLNETSVETPFIDSSPNDYTITGEGNPIPKISNDVPF